VYKDKILIFVHIPKTGGTSLANIIYRQYKPMEVHMVDNLSNDTTSKINKNIKCVLGHNVFGQYKELGPCIYITMLRDPIDRVISQYYYAKNVLKSDGVAKYSLEEFAQLDFVANLQTQFITGSTANLEQAIYNLKTFAFFGITEMFTESLFLMKKTFGWENILYLKENVNDKKPNREKIPKETIEKIEKANSLDIQLYEWAKKHFENRLRHMK
jgi:hypothetical protein